MESVDKLRFTDLFCARCRRCFSAPQSPPALELGCSHRVCHPCSSQFEAESKTGFGCAFGCFPPVENPQFRALRDDEVRAVVESLHRELGNSLRVACSNPAHKLLASSICVAHNCQSSHSLKPNSCNLLHSMRLTCRLCLDHPHCPSVPIQDFVSLMESFELHRFEVGPSFQEFTQALAERRVRIANKDDVVAALNKFVREEPKLLLNDFGRNLDLVRISLGGRPTLTSAGPLRLWRGMSQACQTLKGQQKIDNKGWIEIKGLFWVDFGIKLELAEIQAAKPEPTLPTKAQTEIGRVAKTPEGRFDEYKANDKATGRVPLGSDVPRKSQGVVVSGQQSPVPNKEDISFRKIDGQPKQLDRPATGGQTHNPKYDNKTPPKNGHRISASVISDERGQATSQNIPRDDKTSTKPTSSYEIPVQPGNSKQQQLALIGGLVLRGTILGAPPVNQSVRQADPSARQPEGTKEEAVARASENQRLKTGQATSQVAISTESQGKPCRELESSISRDELEKALREVEGRFQAELRRVRDEATKTTESLAHQFDLAKRGAEEIRARVGVVEGIVVSNKAGIESRVTALAAETQALKEGEKEGSSGFKAQLVQLDQLDRRQRALEEGQKEVCLACESLWDSVKQGLGDLRDWSLGRESKSREEVVSEVRKLVTQLTQDTEARLQKEMNIKAHDGKAQQKLSALEGRISEIQREFEATKQASVRPNDTMDLSSRVTGLEGRLAEIRAQLETATRKDSEHELPAKHERVDRIGNPGRQGTESQDNLGLRQLRNQVEINNSDLKTQSKRLDRLESLMDAARQARESGLGGDKLGQLVARLAAIEGRRDEETRWVGKVVELVNHLTSQQKEAKEKTARLEEDLNSLRLHPPTSGLERQIRELDGKLFELKKDLESKVDSRVFGKLTDTWSEQGKTLGQLEQSVQAGEKKIGGLSSRLAKQESVADSQARDLQSLFDQKSTTSETLERLKEPLGQISLLSQQVAKLSQTFEAFPAAREQDLNAIRRQVGGVSEEVTRLRGQMNLTAKAEEVSDQLRSKSDLAAVQELRGELDRIRQESQLGLSRQKKVEDELASIKASSDVVAASVDELKKLRLTAEGQLSQAGQLVLLAKRLSELEEASKKTEKLTSGFSRAELVTTGQLGDFRAEFRSMVAGLQTEVDSLKSVAGPKSDLQEVQRQLGQLKTEVSNRTAKLDKDLAAVQDLTLALQQQGSSVKSGTVSASESATKSDIQELKRVILKQVGDNIKQLENLVRMRQVGQGPDSLAGSQQNSASMASSQRVSNWDHDTMSLASHTNQPSLPASSEANSIPFMVDQRLGGQGRHSGSELPRIDPRERHIPTNAFQKGSQPVAKLIPEDARPGKQDRDAQAYFSPGKDAAKLLGLSRSVDIKRPSELQNSGLMGSKPTANQSGTESSLRKRREEGREESGELSQRSIDKRKDGIEVMRTEEDGGGEVEKQGRLGLETKLGMTKEQARRIGELFPEFKTSELLFRYDVDLPTENGRITVTDLFHRDCDKHPNTLLILEVEELGLVLAYCDVPWANRPFKTAVRSTKAFVYDLTKDVRYSITSAAYDRAVTHYQYNGPHFGISELVCHFEYPFGFKTSKGRSYLSPAGLNLRDGLFRGLDSDDSFYVPRYEVFELK